MLNFDTKISDLMIALEELGYDCSNIREYAEDIKEGVYLDIIHKVNNDSETPNHILMSFLVVNLGYLHDFNSIEVNSTVIDILLNRAEANIQLLLLWRKVKDCHNILESDKESIKGILKGKLPNAETEEDWL